MATIGLRNFGGMVPKLASRLLPDNLAADTENAKLYSGNLQAWRAPKLVKAIGGPVTSTYRVAYLGTDYWLNWGSDVDIVRTPLVNDTYQRRYWTGETGKGPQVNSAARIASGDPSFDLGVPINTAAITVTPGATGSALDETRFYVITYVTDWGEEGAPCLPVSATGDPTSTWTIGNLPTSTIPSNNVTKIRIYRTITGYNSSDFFYVGEKVIDATSSYADSLSNADAALNNLLESTTWDPPPSTLKGLISHPNGFLVGFSGRDVYMSVPYRPHAWPADYTVSVAYDIVGLGVVGSTIIVLTESSSYAINGIHPQSMTVAQSSIVEPCISKRSIVSFPSGVIYASNNGLVFTNGIESRIITQPIMTIEDWDRDYKSSSIIGVKYDQRYIAFDGVSGFIYDPTSQKEVFVKLKFDFAIEGAYSDETTGKVYLGSNQNVYQFDPSDTNITPYTWKSKEFVAPKPLNFGAYRIKFTVPSVLAGTDPNLISDTQAENTALSTPWNVLGGHMLGGPHRSTTKYDPERGVLGGSGLIPISSLSSATAQLFFRVYADRNVVYEAIVSDEKGHNLPGGFKADLWQFEVVSNLNIHSIDIAESRRELAAI